MAENKNISEREIHTRLLKIVRERYREVCIAIKRYDPDLQTHGPLHILQARKLAYEQQITPLVRDIMELSDVRRDS